MSESVDRIIYKYTIIKHVTSMQRDQTEIKVELPVYMDILDIQLQDDSIVLWGAADSDALDILDTCSFYVVGTGGYVDRDLIHIKTIIKGNLVFHIFSD